MKNWLKLGILAILIIGTVMMSGCTNTGSTPSASQVTSTPTIAIPTTSAVTINQTLQVHTPAPVITTRTTTAQVAYSTSDINRHFIDIAFGPDYSYINKWSKPLVDIGILDDYNAADVTTVNDFSKLFNSYSSYTKIQSEVIEDRMSADIVLRFMRQDSIENLITDNNWKSWTISQNRETGTIYYLFEGTPDSSSSETIYINSDLKGDSRKHWILRALLYELGFPGETGTYPDSMFYSESDTATSLNKIDLKARELMYGKKISYGMDLVRIRQLLQVYEK